MSPFCYADDSVRLLPTLCELVLFALSAIHTLQAGKRNRTEDSGHARSGIEALM